MRPLERTRRHGLLLGFMTVLLFACPTPRPGAEARAGPADLVFLGGAVYTLDAGRSWAEAVAIEGGKIVFVGADRDVEAWIGPDTERVDLAGEMLLPGFHDAHVHPVYGGVQAQRCSLDGLGSVRAMLDEIRDCAEHTQTEGWLLASRWDLALFPDGNAPKELLDEIAPDRPVFVAGVDGHSAWVNSKALEIAGVDRDTPDPPLGVIERDAVTGEPSGTLRESAMQLVSRHVPETTPQERLDGLRLAVKMANGFGITSLIDAGVGEAELIAYQTLDDAGELSVRAELSLEWGTNLVSGTTDFEQLLRKRKRYAGPRRRPDSIKLFVDGVLEGETAALVDPYLGSDEPRGTLNFTPETLRDLVVRFDAAGLQVHMHAIGDLAVRIGLDAVGAAREANGPSDNRHHIVHLQLVHPTDLPRFAELGVVANFQAAWAYPDSYITEINLPALGPDRVNRMFPIGSVHRAGATVVGGSDWDVSSMSPLVAIQTALTREDPDGVVRGVLNADERVGLDAMLAAYTRNGAYLMHQEHVVGSIEVGKAADVIVLEKNLFEVPPREIGSVGVLRTLIDGETVYRAR
jgi:predicted amidohydrolase YtcJ